MNFVTTALKAFSVWAVSMLVLWLSQRGLGGLVDETTRLTLEDFIFSTALALVTYFVPNFTRA